VIGQKIVFLLNLRKENSGTATEKVGRWSAQTYGFASNFGNNSGGTLGLSIDNDTAWVYSAFRFVSRDLEKSVHPFNQCSHLRFDHSSGSN
jgi:hypothetical protein